MNQYYIPVQENFSSDFNPKVNQLKSTSLQTLPSVDPVKLRYRPCTQAKGKHILPKYKYY